MRHGLLTTLAATGAGLALTGCGLVEAVEGDQAVSMVVTENAPFQEPTEIAKEQLAEADWELETTYVTDIIQPNFTVSNGEYDVNFFQNLTYLQQFNEDHDLDLEPIFFMFEQPSGLYSKDYDSLDELPDGAEVALPVDTANNGRGIRLLAREASSKSTSLRVWPRSVWMTSLRIRRTWSSSRWTSSRWARYTTTSMPSSVLPDCSQRSTSALKRR